VVSVSPRRRKLRLVRADAVPADLVLLVRAAPASVDEAVDDIARDALQSGRTYVVLDETGKREPLFGVSTFAHRPGVSVLSLLARFDDAPSYLEAQVGAMRSAGFTVLPTGTNPDHFDIQLLPGRADDNADEPVLAVRAAAARLVAVAGELRPNPIYHEESDRTVEDE
jgi:hypothetical protein